MLDMLKMCDNIILSEKNGRHNMNMTEIARIILGLRADGWDEKNKWFYAVYRDRRGTV